MTDDGAAPDQAPRRRAAGDDEGASAPASRSGSPELRSRLEAAEREEEWAFLRLVGWIALLAFVLFVLLFSPVPWGALVGLALWALGARAVYTSFTEAVERLSDLRARLGEVEPAGTTENVHG